MHNDVIISAIATQITGFSIVCSAVCSGADQRKQSSASLAVVRGIPRWAVDYRKEPVTRKFFHLMTSVGVTCRKFTYIHHKTKVVAKKKTYFSPYSEISSYTFILCYVIPCHVISCHVILYYITMLYVFLYSYNHTFTYIFQCLVNEMKHIPTNDLFHLARHQRCVCVCVWGGGGGGGYSNDDNNTNILLQFHTNVFTKKVQKQQTYDDIKQATFHDTWDTTRLCVALYDGNTGKFLAVKLIMKPCLLILPWKTIILDDLLEERYRRLGCARSCGILEIDMMNSELFAVTSRPFEVVHQWPYSVADHVTVIQFDCWKENNILTYGVSIPKLKRCIHWILGMDK